MNAINKLKAMLDERGVKYRDNVYSCNTQWMSLNRGAAYASQCKHDESLLELTVYTVTPQQAIDATLGRGECKDTGGADEFCCSECGCVLRLTDRDGLNTLCTGFIVDCPHYCPSCGRQVQR